MTREEWDKQHAYLYEALDSAEKAYAKKRTKKITIKVSAETLKELKEIAPNYLRRKPNMTVEELCQHWVVERLCP